jgi:hypothetical protein
MFLVERERSLDMGKAGIRTDQVLGCVVLNIF